MKHTTLLLLLLLATVLPQMVFAQSAELSPFDTTQYGRNEHAGRYVTLRGFNMYYEIYGHGDPLLMIHGNGGSISSFMYQIPYFSKKYTVIAVDSRAQGKSADTRDTLSFEMMADDFSALLDVLHLDSCYVLGWSDGGINGLLLAIRHPEKVRKLAITGANLWPDSTAIRAADVLGEISYLDALMKMPPTPEVVNARKLVRLDVLQPHITDEQLQEIHCPALIIGGDHDLILPQHTMYIAQAIPEAYLWILPNSSHSTLMDYTEEFNETVDDFFQSRLNREH